MFKKSKAIGCFFFDVLILTSGLDLYCLQLAMKHQKEMEQLEKNQREQLEKLEKFNEQVQH